MSILETFFIMFKSDASEVKKGAEEAKKSTASLESSLKNIDKTSERAGQSFLTLARSASSVIGAFASAGLLVGGFRDAINEIKTIGDASRALNVNVETLDAWGHAVQRTGGTAQGFQASLKALSMTMNSTAAVALQSLPVLADSFAKMNDAQAMRYGMDLGLDQSTIYLLQQGRREVEAIIQKQKELGLVTKQDVEITRKYDNALYDLGRVFNEFKREATLPLLPFLQEGFQYLIEHKDLIKGALLGISGAASVLTGVLLKFNPVFAAVTAAVIAFALAYEDFKKFQEGAPSVIGKAVDAFNSTVKGSEVLIKHVAPSFLSDQTLSSFTDKYAHLPKFLGGQGYGGNTNTVNVGDVTINTNATDGEGVVQAFKNYKDELWQSNSHFDNGVTI